MSTNTTYKGGKSAGEIASLFFDAEGNHIFTDHFPTGFPKLDKELGGGFIPGLHCIGAGSGTGKTTFALQMAVNMAKNGIPCLFFSLEMKSTDLVAKAISAETYMMSDGKEIKPKTMNSLLSKHDSERFTSLEKKSIEEAVRNIVSLGDLLIIYERGVEEICDANWIEKKVSEYMSQSGIIPVVVIDYLQILDSVEAYGVRTDKQLVDGNLKVLKRIVERKNIPLLIISSFNRENYAEESSFKSFKSSGNIEYSCDTVIGMQLKRIGKSSFCEIDEKKKDPRDIELILLKQRFGPVGKKISYSFYTEYNYFSETILREKSDCGKKDMKRY